MINKLLITCVLTVLTLIILKSNTDLKSIFYEKVYKDNFSFAEVNKIYKSYFGDSIPFKNVLKTTDVFDEKLTYTEKEKYKDGVALTVNDDYLVPNQLSGIVVFIGEKEGYGNTIIIQQSNGIDMWYGNIKTVNVKIYDYVETGVLLGNSYDKLYIVFEKKGKYLNCDDYF